MNTPPTIPALDPISVHGKMIAGRYQILKRLGSGGMSDVWHAYDLKLRTEVALKFLRLQNEDSAEAIRREVRIAREVISPNVCRLFDLVTEEEQELISMEYIDGVTLTAFLLQNGPLDLSEALGIATQFLAGLEAIHKAGLIHCDLKPENIMISCIGRVAVMDFGIARHAVQENTTASGTLPYMDPERISGGPVTVQSDIYAAGIILAEMMFPERILTEQTRETIWSCARENPLELPDNPWKAVISCAVAENSQDRFASASELSRALEEITVRTEADEGKTPYPGLASFQDKDSGYFFGREQEIETLIKKLQHHYLIALIGPSGAGKTSLLQAGLIAALPKDWVCVVTHPGDAPLVNLRQSLAPLLSNDKDADARITSLEDPQTILSHLRQAYEEFVLIVDRFEELFTLNPIEVQSRFAEILEHAAMEANIRIVLSMRDDFLIFCKEHAPLAPIFSELTAMLPLTGAALRRALVQPALKCGYRFEDETLVDDILRELEKERGALPLLAFAASLLWERRDRQKGILTRQAYQEIGGVQGALAQHAETTMSLIGFEKEPIVREIFRNLITARHTRTARDTEELLSVFPHRQAAEEVLRKLIDSRLLTSFEASTAQGEDAKRRVEISHESLITTWPRLVRWQTQDADTAQFRDQLRQAAQLWEQRNRSQDLLWTGTALSEFKLWRERYPGGLSKTEIAFAQAMIHRASKKRSRQRIVAGTTFVILLAFLILFFALWRRSSDSRDEAILQTKRAQAATVLTVGRSTENADATTKLAYALSSLEIADTQDARRFALQALSEVPAALAIKVPVAQAAAIDFSPDGKWLVTGGVEGVQVLPADGKSPFIVSDFRSNPLTVPERPQFSGDGQFVIWTSGKDRSVVIVWSQSSKRIVRTFHLEGYTLSKVKNGNAILITDTTRKEWRSNWGPGRVRIRTWKFDNQEPELFAEMDLPSTHNPDVSENLRWIGYRDGENIYVRPLDGKAEAKRRLVGKHGDEAFVLFRPGAEEIASMNAIGELRLWSMAAETPVPVRIIPAVEKSGVYNFWFHPNGKLVVVGDGTVIRQYDLTAPPDFQPVVIRHLKEEFSWVTFDQSGHWLAVSWDGTLAFYPLVNAYPYTMRGVGNGSFNIRFTPDGKSLINGFDTGGIHIWSTPGENQTPSRVLWKPANGNIFPIGVDTFGKFIIAGTNDTEAAQGIHIISVADGSSFSLKRCLPNRVYDSVAFSPDGKFAAAVAIHGDAALHGIEIWNLESRDCRVIEKSRGKASFCVKYAPDGTLFSGDSNGNLYHWDLKNDTSKVFRVGKGIVTGIDISADGGSIATSALTAKQWSDVPVSTSDVKILDLKNNKTFPITSHGTRVFRVALDAQGTRLITGDLDGEVRVGPINGETPHLLIGHKSQVGDVTVSPNGRWIASTGFLESEVRLWPMPHGQPLHALPYEELLKRLRVLTNVRAVQDQNTATGYRLEYAPFPGWSRIN